MIRLIATLFAALCGLCFGSFLNVCLSRWPLGESVVQPRSHCRNCSHTLSWWENIPLLSWLVLRGRCRECRTAIHWRYPLVEALVGGLWAIYGFRFILLLQNFFGFMSVPSDREIAAVVLHTVAMLIFSWLMVALIFLDAEHFWLPDRLTLGGILPALLIFAADEWMQHLYVLSYRADLVSFLLMLAIWSGKVLVAATALLLVRWLYWLVRRREGLGLGDVKLVALLAAWLGLPQTILAFVLAVLLGSLAAVVVLLRPAPEEGRAAKMLPLGTFLCIGGIFSSLWGEPLIRAYLRWAGF